jgi:hypothetical protein
MCCTVAGCVRLCVRLRATRVCFLALFLCCFFKYLPPILLARLFFFAFFFNWCFFACFFDDFLILLLSLSKAFNCLVVGILQATPQQPALHRFCTRVLRLCVRLLCFLFCFLLDFDFLFAGVFFVLFSAVARVLPSALAFVPAVAEVDDTAVLLVFVLCFVLRLCERL